MADVLVTGGAGFIGSHLVDRLIELGHAVTVLDDLSMGRREHVHPQARLVVGDVVDRDLVQRLVREAEVVLHQAARVSIRDSLVRFREDALTNVVGTLNVLEAMRGANVRRFVLASSMGVYGVDGRGVRESDVAERPRSPYGVGKLAAESYALTLCPQLGVECVALRYCNTYGPRQTPTPYVGVTTLFAHALLSGRTPIVYDDGEQVRDYVYVGDVVEANVRALETRAVNDVYNVGTGEPVTVNQILAHVAQHLGVSVTPERRPAHPGELRTFTADVSKAASALGFRARHSFAEKVGEVVDYWRARAAAGPLPDLRG